VNPDASWTGAPIPKAPMRPPPVTKRQIRRERYRKQSPADRHLTEAMGIPFQPKKHGARPEPVPLKTNVRDYQARDRILRELGWPNYGVYLKSELWARIRRSVLKADANTCFRCGRRAWMVHHVHYSRSVLLGHDLTPLLSVCGPCHHQIEIEPNGRKRTLEGAAEVVGVVLVPTHPPRADGGPGTPTSAVLPSRNANTTRPRSGASKSGVR